MRVKAIASVLIGIVFLGFAIMSLLETRHFLKTAIAVPGVVISPGPGGVHADIEFVTKAGEKISYTQNGDMPKMTAGQRVTVLYRPEAPWNGPTIDRFSAIWTVTAGLFFFAAGGIFLGLLGYMGKPRNNRA